MELSASLEKIRAADEILQISESRNAKIKELENELKLVAGKNSQYDALTARLAELQNGFNEKKDALYALREDMQVKDKEIAELKAEVRSAKRLAEEKDAQILLLKKDREVAAKHAELSSDVLSENFAYNISTGDDDSDQKNPALAAHEEKLNARKLFNEVSEKLSITQHQLHEIETKYKEEQAAHKKTLAEQEELKKEVSELKLNFNEARVSADTFRGQFKAEEKARIEAEARVAVLTQQNGWLEKKLLHAKLVEVDNRQLVEYNNQVTSARDQAELNAFRAEELRVKAEIDSDVSRVKMESAVARSEKTKDILFKAKEEAVNEVSARLESAEAEVQQLRKAIKELQEQLETNRTTSRDSSSASRTAERKVRLLERQLEDAKEESRQKDRDVLDFKKKLEELKAKHQKVVLEKEDYCSQATLLSHKLGLKSSLSS
eukprot:TRINITY_DN705_c0_g1_i1.p1 TRINITY_DN705_c0_g1~~TRINITY_DN705_c0_g1_i1.p1  ORF type:complete len:435 (-),score=163.60 TRINITY_DN705_c0_g1_i1:75-1379(-)